MSSVNPNASARSPIGGGIPGGAKSSTARGEQHGGPKEAAQLQAGAVAMLGKETNPRNRGY